MSIIAEGGFPCLLQIKPRERAQASVIAVGSVQETASWMVRRLRAIGYEVKLVANVEVLKSAIEEAIASALNEVDLVVIVGGIELGSAPAFEAVASVLGRQLVEDEEAKRMVEEYHHFIAGGSELASPEEYRVFYTLPDGSIVLRNPKGPAPGILLEENDKYLLCVPGALAEAGAIVEEEADQYIRELLGVRLSASVHIMTKSWDEEGLWRVAEEVSKAAPWAFVQVKRNVFSKDGWGVTITVFAKTPSDLSEKLVKAVELTEEGLRRNNIQFLEKNLNELL